MTRALFLQTLRRSLLHTAALLLVVIGSLALLGVALQAWARMRGAASGAAHVPDEVFGIALVLCSFHLGASTFPDAFRQRHALFLHALPIGRGLCWAALVSGRLLALLLGCAVLAALRPSFLPFSAGPSWASLLGVPLTFAAGCCVALFSRNTAAVYGFGLLFYLAILFEVVGAIQTLTMGALHPGAPDAEQSRDLLLRSIPIGLVLGTMIAACLAASWRLYAAGAPVDPFRRRSRLLAIAASVLLVPSVLRSPPVLSLLASAPWEAHAAEPSPDGERLCLLESARSAPGLFRLKLVEPRSGRIVSTLQTSGVMAFAWAPDGDAFTLVRNRVRLLVLGGLLPGKAMIDVSIERYTADGVAMEHRILASRMVSHAVATGNGSLELTLWSRREGELHISVDLRTGGSRP
jgi:hypothetical protein